MLLTPLHAFQAKPSVVEPAALVDEMVRAEKAASQDKEHFLYKRTERSTRTKGHLWVEAVVETSDGRMHRLLSQDGKPLTERERATEEERISYLVHHPDDFRRENQARRDDESKASELLKLLPRAFNFREDGSQGSCIRIHFSPNPAFQEQNFQDRILHAAMGYLLIEKGSSHRLCGINANLEHDVVFGYGLLGKVSRGSGFVLARSEVAPGQWKLTALNVHVDGNVLLLKSVSRQEESVHSDFKVVPSALSIDQAAKMVHTPPS